MHIARESDMIAPLKRALPALLCPVDPYAVACEVPDGARVVDLMYAVMPYDVAELQEAAPVASRLSRMSIAQLMVLALIWRNGRVSTPKLSELTHIAQGRLEQEYLAPFARAGLIERHKRSWRVGPWSTAAPAQLLAVEAKLEDWRTALDQADDNRTRADLSYVALPRVVRSNLRQQILEAARVRGLGVIELHPNGGAELSLNAKAAPRNLCSHKWHMSLRLLGDVASGGGRWSFSRTR